ncbi:MAG: LemA family protein [Bacilli bacterium]|nr:LemA family protein [Bacilli bacterium]
MKLTIFLLIIILVGVISLLFFAIYNKISYLFSKTKYSDELIDKCLEEKYKLLIKLNNSIKKTLHAKKDYLTDINKMKDLDISSEEKDEKLSDYVITVKNLISDYTKLATNKNIKAQINDLNEIDEKLDAYKTYFNKYMMELSSNYVKFPTNFVAKVSKVKIKKLYQTNDTISKLSEEL